MPTLLLELFSEEIPARMQADAAVYLQTSLEKALNAKAKIFVTPRRLAAVIENLPSMQADVSQELKGPKVDAPEAALAGFLKKTGVAKEQLEIRDGVYFANIHQKGRATSEVLKEVIEKILAEFPWPKSMRWGSGETAWVRPLHSMICLFDGKVVPVEFAGVKASNKTRGHRFLAPSEITVNDASAYEAALEKAYVVPDREKRKAEIAKQLDAKCKALGVSLHVDAGLLEEVTGLVEWPNVLSGKIDASVMDLPEEVLILEMKNHQKYFATRTPTQPSPLQGEGEGGGKLSPHFLITSNMVTKDDGKAIIAGNERVLRARFADGRFFYDQDRKTKLEDWAKKLSDVTYHAKLGSVADKVTRIKALARVILNEAQRNEGSGILRCAQDDIEKAAQLCKADLVTGMVGEFPELQGVMGRYYANHQKEKPEVADAIADHYKPQGPNDSVPSAPVSICVALADKLDTLVSMFAIGEKPTGSKDPFALRRAALGVIRIILENNLRFSLRAVIPPDGGIRIPQQVRDDIMEFFHDRLIVQLKEQNIRHDVIKAVVAKGDDDLVRIVARARSLQEFLGTEDGANLLAGYKRAANIIAIEQKKDKISYLFNELNPAVLAEEEEKALAKLLQEKDPEITAFIKQEKFKEAMKSAALLRKSVDQFFDKIMVNAEQKELRANRLRLLSGITGSLNNLADFSLIEA